MTPDPADRTEYVRVVIEAERGHRFAGQVAAYALACELGERGYDVEVRLVGGDAVGLMIEDVTLSLMARGGLRPP
jgi:hypothetical protein